MLKLEPVGHKKQQKKFLTAYWFVEQGTSEKFGWHKIDPVITWTHLQLIWNHSGPSEVPYFANQ